MYILLEDITIDYVKSLKFHQIFIDGGKYESAGVLHDFPDSVVKYSCTGEDNRAINYYIDLSRQTINTVDGHLHLGGVILDANCKVKNYLNPVRDCLSYERAFSEAFDISLNKITETIDTCAEGGSINYDYDSGFDID